MQKINWGIIGPGSIAKTFADALAISDEGQLYAVASRNIERATDFAGIYGATAVYDNYQTLIDDPKVDIIYIATPQSHHYQQAKLCLQAGKALLLEKPCTINAQQMAVLVELAQDNGVFFQEALWSRFMPCFAQVKQWIAQGKIGELQYINSDIGFAFDDKPEHRLNNPDLGGGALLDLGVYSITLSQFILDEYPSAIQASAQLGSLAVHGHKLDLNTQVNMCYPSGCIGQFTCTTMAQSSNSMHIVGTKGRITLPTKFWVGEKAMLYKSDELVEELSFPHKGNGFEYQIKQAMDCVKQGRPYSECMPHADSLAVMKVMDEVRQQIGLHYSERLEAL